MPNIPLNQPPSRHYLLRDQRLHEQVQLLADRGVPLGHRLGRAHLPLHLAARGAAAAQVSGDGAGLGPGQAVALAAGCVARPAEWAGAVPEAGCGATREGVLAWASLAQNSSSGGSSSPAFEAPGAATCESHTRRAARTRAQGGDGGGVEDPVGCLPGPGDRRREESPEADGAGQPAHGEHAYGQPAHGQPARGQQAAGQARQQGPGRRRGARRWACALHVLGVPALRMLPRMVGARFVVDCGLMLLDLTPAGQRLLRPPTQPNHHPPTCHHHHRCCRAALRRPALLASGAPPWWAGP